MIYLDMEINIGICRFIRTNYKVFASLNKFMHILK